MKNTENVNHKNMVQYSLAYGIVEAKNGEIERSLQLATWKKSVEKVSFSLSNFRFSMLFSIRNKEHDIEL